MEKFYLTEKRNHNVIHAIFDSQESAQRHLNKVIPEYCKRGYFMDKTLTPDDFEIVPQI
jgi:hypothetical protein